MKLIAATFILASISFIAACSPAAKTPTSAPTYAPPPTPVILRCIEATEAAYHVNEYICIKGIVLNTYQSPYSDAFFIHLARSTTDFSTATSLNLVSFNYGANLDRSLLTKGTCIEVRGQITSYGQLPEIIIGDRNQLKYCLAPQPQSLPPVNWDAPTVEPHVKENDSK